MGTIDPTMQAGYPPQVPPQQSVPPPPLPVAPPSGSKKRIMLIVAGIVVLLFILGGAAVAMRMQSSSNTQIADSGKDQPVATDSSQMGEPTPTIEIPTLTPTVTKAPEYFPDSVSESRVAYVSRKSEGPTSIDTLVLYDPTTEKSVFEFTPEASDSASIMPFAWSPDGSMLPFMVTVGDSKASLYIYESASNTTQELSVQDTMHMPIVFSDGINTALWEEIYRLSAPFLSNVLTGEDVSVDVEENSVVPVSAKSDSLIARSAYLTVHKTESPTFIITTSTASFNYSLSDASSASIVGLTNDGNLIVVEGSDQVSASPLKIEDVKPRFSKAEIVFKNIGTGAVTGTVALGSDQWYTVGVELTADQENLIVHQVEATSAPTNERFIQYTIATKRPRLLFSNKIESNINEYALGMIESGFSFWLVPGSDWIVKYSGPIEDSTLQSITMQNMKTKEAKTICEHTCHGLVAYNPQAVTGNLLSAE